ncbi:class I lanthipeptide [Parabacteroides pacaensis]|uniref:class I lanthipeptide n=1 Tax=Parabacteroides pacaensis TaxID=2086575 RepID=UPI000D1127AC|nr:class I lanthipeptide [Parabacteroides pacaensis]
MKKLRKLKFNKEVIVNLSDQQMGQIQGGTGTYTSSEVCINISWAVSGYLTGHIADYLYDQYMKSKNPEVDVHGWLSRDYFEGFCCISDVEVNC